MEAKVGCSKGFSLIEALLALTLGGLALVAATSLLVSLSGAWSRDAPAEKVFEARCHSLRHFLYQLVEDSIGKIEVKEWPAEGDDPVVRLFLEEPPPVFWSKIPGGRYSQVEAFLHSEGEELSIYWHSSLFGSADEGEEEEQPEDEEDYFRISLMEEGCRVEYCYLAEAGENAGSDEWEREDELREKEGKWEAPQAIVLTLSGEDAEDQMITLYLDTLLPSGEESEPYW